MTDIHYRYIGLCLFLLFMLITHFSIPSLAHQGWDSLAYAWYVEETELPLNWGNHPLVHLLQAGIYRLSVAWGFDGRALTLLQFTNTLFTSASVTLFFSILVKQWKYSLIEAAGWAAFFGSGYALIFNTGTAEIYPAALLLMLSAWKGILIAREHPSHRQMLLTGILIGLAGLAHQFNAILLGTAAAAGFLYRPKSSFLSLVAGGFVTMLTGYVGLGYLAVDSLDLLKILDWIRGYGVNPQFGRNFSLDGLELALTSGSESLIRSTDQPFLSGFRSLLFGLFPLLIILAPSMCRSGISGVIELFLYSVLPLLVGLLFIIWWEPVIQGKWWNLILPLFTTLLAAGLPDKTWSRLIPVILAVSVLTLNQLNGLRYAHQPDKNFEAALEAWIDHSSRDDVLYESDYLGAHLLFWADRPGTIGANVLNYFENETTNPHEPLKLMLEDAWKRGVSVLYTEGLDDYYSDERLGIVGTSREELKAFFDSYQQEGPVFQYREYEDGPVTKVYRLLPHDNP